MAKMKTMAVCGYSGGGVWRAIHAERMTAVKKREN